VTTFAFSVSAIVFSTINMWIAPEDVNFYNHVEEGPAYK